MPTRRRADRTPTRAHFGAWRGVAELPAIAGGALVLTFLFGFLGRWEPIVLFDWLAFGLLLLTSRAEPFAVRAFCRFRRPTPRQRDIVLPAWSLAVDRLGLGGGRLDWYVVRSRVSNAFAAGRHSVAVTTALLEDVVSGRLSRDQFAGVLAHEFGHLSTQATRHSPAMTWLSAPWRIAARTTYRAATAFTSRRRPPWLLAVVASMGFAVAIGQGARAENWPVVATLTALIVCAVAAPLIDAAISRSGEYAADGFAADIGLGADLAAAITVLDGGRGDQSMAVRLLARHPNPDARAHYLQRDPSQWRQALADS